MTFKHKLSARLALMRAALLAAAVAAACTLGDETIGPTTPSATLAQIIVSPAAKTLEAGQSFPFTAYGRTRGGDSIAAAVAWSATGGTISGDGLFTAGPAPGAYQVTATAPVGAGVAGTATVAGSAAAAGTTTVADTATVEVIPVRVAAVIVTPDSATLALGSSRQLAAVVKDAAGNLLTGRAITWSTSFAEVATVSEAGVVTGVAVGSATIAATSEGQQGTARVSVAVLPVTTVELTPATASMSVGGSVQFSATPRDASGNPLVGRVVAWASSDAAVATITPTGLVTGVAAGSATITATSEGQSATAAVTVTNVPVASVTLSPASANVTVGQAVQLTATLRDTSGNVLSGRVVTWSSSTPGVATVSGSGVVSGVAAGSATITATSEGQSATAAVTVTNVPVASVAVSPASASLTVGQTVQLTATLKDAAGNVLSGRPVVWSTSGSSVAGVSASGLVTGVVPGTATITATSEGKSGSASITVSGAGGGAAAWVEENFAAYASTTQLVTTPNPAVWAQLNLSANVGQIALDQNVGYTAGGLTQSMRYDFASIGSQCRDYSIRLGFFKFPTPILPGQAVWVEVVARFAPNFTTEAGAAGCNEDYKFLFIGANPDGRVELKSGTYGNPGYWSANYPGGVADIDAFTTASAWDGQWHTYRIYAKVSTTSSTADGAYTVWIDGVKKIDRQNIAYRNGSGGAVTSLWALTPGANLNQGPLNPTSIWWGRIRAWNTNPGW